MLLAGTSIARGGGGRKKFFLKIPGAAQPECEAEPAERGMPAEVAKMAKCQLCEAVKDETELFGCLCCWCDKIRGYTDSDRAVEV